MVLFRVQVGGPWSSTSAWLQSRCKWACACMQRAQCTRMLQRAKDAPCFMCETMPGRWNDPAIAMHPEQAHAELEGLVRRLVELRSGQTTPDELRSHMLEMCAMCQAIVMDAGEGTSREEVISRIEFRITRLHRLGDAPRRTTTP